MIQGKKKALSSFLASTGLHRAVRVFSPQRLTIFNFHRIRESDTAATSEFDSEVFGPTAEEFRTHLSWVKANASIISETELLSSLRDCSALPQRSVMITFDDGYIDNFTLALPILKELRIPAIYFIPTQAIEERVLGWWDLIAYLVKKTDRSEITLAGERLSVDPGGELLKTRLQRQMKLRSAAESETLVRDLSEACGVPLPSRERCSRELMTWDQVRETAASGVAIGSHTHSHRVLATLDLAAQREELSRSKRELEAQLGMGVRTLAYPVGGYEHFHRETKTVAKECGYEAAFSFHTGINLTKSIEPFDIKRLSAPEEAVLYCGALALPSVFARRKCEATAPASA